MTTSGPQEPCPLKGTNSLWNREQTRVDILVPTIGPGIEPVTVATGGGTTETGDDNRPKDQTY